MASARPQQLYLFNGGRITRRKDKHMLTNGKSRRSGSLAGIGGALLALTACSDATPDDTIAPYAVATEPSGNGEAHVASGGKIGTGEFETPYGRQRLTYVEIDGERIFEGDIVLPKEHPDYRSGGVSAFAQRWPNGIVPYESTGLFNDSRVTAAIAHWQARLPLVFRPGATTGPRIQFVAPTDPGLCSSSVGRTGSAQSVNLGSGCTTGNAIHEIGHALGLFHEQSRTDRDNFVTVNTGCILPIAASNFDTFGTSGINIGPYDVDSIMHYGSTFFVNNAIPGCTATITKKDGTLINANRTALTGLDIAGVQSLYQAWFPRRKAVDYDGDGKTDVAVWRPSEGRWYIIQSHNGVSTGAYWGLAGDVPVPGDYTGDGKTDLAVWRPSEGNWYVVDNATNTFTVTQLGQAGDVPVYLDYNLDHRLDLAVWRPSNGTWMFNFGTGTFSLPWGTANDVPVAFADYDFSQGADLTVWRPSEGRWDTWWPATGARPSTYWGLMGDIAVPADYDGDGHTDRAVWRPSEGRWYIIQSRNGAQKSAYWGLAGDVPVPGDYTGDGKADLAVWRPSDGGWYIVDSATNTSTLTYWGLAGDVPVP